MQGGHTFASAALSGCAFASVALGLYFTAEGCSATQSARLPLLGAVMGLPDMSQVA